MLKYYIIKRRLQCLGQVITMNQTRVVKHILKISQTQCTSYVVDLHSGGARFESRPEH
jgi:hypothetical protein